MRSVKGAQHGRVEFGTSEAKASSSHRNPSDHRRRTFLQGLFRPGANFINNFGPASIAYVILLMLILFLIGPGQDSVMQIAVTAFLLTCAIEFLQLWHPNWLTGLRQTVLGRLVLGTTFNVLDFPAYLVGAIIGSLALKRICRD